MKRNEISRRSSARRPAAPAVWRTLAVWLMACTLAVLCAVPALAVPEEGFYNYILDGAGVLTEEEADALEEQAAALVDEYGFAPCVVTVDGLSGVDADDAAFSFYDEYALGAGEYKLGAILLVDTSDGSHSFLVMNTEDVDELIQSNMEELFLEAFQESWYAGFAQYIENFEAYFYNRSDDGGGSSAGYVDVGGIDGYFILDYADILSDEEELELEDRAWDIAQTYGFAPCVIVEDSLDGWGAKDRAYALYRDNELGIGPDNNGSLLYMSMEDRDFYYLVEDHAAKVFDEYERLSIEAAFKARFRNDDWYGGFTEYLNGTEHYLSGAGDVMNEETGDWNYYGDYVPSYRDTGPGFTGYLMMFGIPIVLALIICLVMLSSMKSVRHAAQASSYVKDGGLKLSVKEDVFTHTTETRVKVESESSKGGGGGHSHGGGGSFGGGGKF